MGIGLPELLVIGSLGVLFFGARRFPEVFSNLGKTVKSFKSGLSGEEEEKRIRDVEELNKKIPPKD